MPAREQEPLGEHRGWGSIWGWGYVCQPWAHAWIWDMFCWLRGRP